MAGRPKRRARLIAAHKKSSAKCKLCGKKHDRSAHWSHAIRGGGVHPGVRFKKVGYARKARPQGRRKAVRKALHPRRAGRRVVVRRGFTRGGTTFGPVYRHHEPRVKQQVVWGGLSAAEVRRMGKKARLARERAERERHRHPEFAAAVAMGHEGHKHRVKGHLAKTPGSSHKHRVKGHLAAFPNEAAVVVVRSKRGGGGRKKPRSAAQKAATARMLAGLARKRAGKAGRKKGKTHLVKGHLAKTAGSRKKHRVKGHRAKNPKRGGGGGRKKPRSAAQKAATARMLAGLARKRAGKHSPVGTKPLTKADLKVIARRRARLIREPMRYEHEDIRPANRPRLG